MKSPHIKTALPGPKAEAMLKRDALVVSPSYPRDYPFVISHAKGVEAWNAARSQGNGMFGDLGHWSHRDSRSACREWSARQPRLPLRAQAPRRLGR